MRFDEGSSDRLSRVFFFISEYYTRIDRLERNR